MKRYLSLFIIVIALSLTGCGGSSTPASDKAIACAKEAIEVAESYLAYDIDYDEARERIDELKEDMEYVDDMSREDENYRGDYGIQFDISMLSFAIMQDEHNGSNETYQDVQEKIEDLKESIK